MAKEKRETTICLGDLTIDSAGRLIINDPALADELRKAASLPNELAQATNNAIMCGCNVVANCGGTQK